MNEKGLLQRELRAVVCAASSISLLLLGSCSKHEEATHSVERAPVKPIDACALLTAAEIEALQGEPLQKTIGSAPPEGGRFTVAQCYFNLTNNTNSIVLTVTQRGTGPNAKDAREFWEESFRGEGRHKEEEREGEKRNEPLKVDGIGDEAFWAGSPIGGALYVLKGDVSVRISTGGTDQLERVKKIAAVVVPKI